MTTSRGASLLLLSAFFLFVSLAGPASAVESPHLTGFVRGSGGSVDSIPSFLEGGFGKLVDGGHSSEGRSEVFNGGIGEARLALDWELGAGWGLFVHGAARRDAASLDGSAGSGLLEAFVERRFGDGEWHVWTLRAGQFFLPASRENVGSLWTTPYTLTLSAMNSWVAEEIRPIGVDLAWTRTFASDHKIHLGATVFGGNDTSGTLLAWRGFSFHDRPTPTNRFVPVPPFAGREEVFPGQSRQGTKAFGSDLDSRPGYAGRIRWISPDNRATVQATAFLNRGDRALHGDEYSWDTDFRWLSAQTELPAGLLLLGEWGTGTSRMGFVPGQPSKAVVDITFDTFYLLLTRDWGIVRATVRYDDFRVDDNDSTTVGGSILENNREDNREDGRAWTLAVLVPLGQSWRAGVEYLDLEVDRPAAVRAGFPQPDGDSVRAEVRYAF